MRRIKDIIFNTPKEKIITVFCIFVAVAAIIISTILFASAYNGKTEEPLPSEAPTYSDELLKPTYHAESPKSLEYQSIGGGMCVVSGIGGFSGDELEIPEKSPEGEAVIGIAAGAFEGCDELISVYIPSSIATIGDSAFKGCSSLVVINVESSNSKFSSVGGVLFTKNKTQLICYPASRVGSSYLLNPNVKAISANAFYGAKNLVKINYEGSPAEFQEIEIGDGNKAFSDLPITCNYTPSK